jgi:hypothetical protein
MQRSPVSFRDIRHDRRGRAADLVGQIPITLGQLPDDASSPDRKLNRHLEDVEFLVIERGLHVR